MIDINRKIVDKLGVFRVIEEPWGSVLVHEDHVEDSIENTIATARNPNYLITHGTLEKWLKKILNRELTRINKIERQLQELKAERIDRINLIKKINGALE